MARCRRPCTFRAATSYYEFRDAFSKTGEEQHILEQLRWVTDAFLRCSFLDAQGKMVAFCYMVGEGADDHTYWGPPELQPKNKIRPADFATAETPASDITAGTTAALALSYLNFKTIDPEYAQKCLTYAKAMYEFSRSYRGLGTGDGFYNSTGDEDELSWAAVWLYVCTGDIEYIRHIDSTSTSGLYTGYMKKIAASTQDQWQNIWTHCWEAVWGGVFTKLAALFPDNKRFDYFSRWSIEFLSGGVIKHEEATDTNYLKLTPAGYTMMSTWGSARYNTAVQLCALVYQKYHPQRTDFGDWAKTQMQYIMGRNPMGYSYIVGYGKEKGLPSASHPHHRAAHGSKTLSMVDPIDQRHVLWGALVGGPDGSDSHVDVTDDFVYNEVAIDYNAAFVGACAGLYLLYGQGQQTVPNFPPKEPAFDAYFCEAKIEQETDQRSQMKLMIHNESSKPPRFERGLAARYFFNISELLNKGQSINDVSLMIEYDEAGILNGAPVKYKGPIQWDQNGTYYYEFDWSSGDLYGDRELQFSIVAKQGPNWVGNWDATNDWSRKSLTQSYTTAKYISTYLNGVKVFGEEPPRVEATPTPTGINPSPTPDNSASIKIMYQCGKKDDITDTIRPYFEVQNTGKNPINLEDVKIRYWFTGDGAASYLASCDWAQMGLTKVTGKVSTIDKPVANADMYCEVGFTPQAGTLAPGTSTGAIMMRIYRSDYQTCNQANDYSFNGSMASMGENLKVSGYILGTLKYGTEPVTTNTPPPPGFKISGYISPDFPFADSASAKLKGGFKVELGGTGKTATTDKSGYFEIVNVPSGTAATPLTISKPYYLTRIIKNLVITKDISLGSIDVPIDLWAGDILEDSAINMSDIMELARVFNSTLGDTRYRENFDLNRDDAVNMADIMICAKHFNRIPGDYPNL